jgi:hypothetical protein
MRLDASGNLGIGTSSPAAKFETFDSAVSAAYVAATPSTWRVAQVRNNGTVNANNAAGIAFVGRTDVEPAGIVAINSTTGGGITSLAFLPVTGNQPFEAMRLDSSGNLGLGVTPSAWRTSEYKAIQVGIGASFYGRVTAGDEDKAGFSANAFFDQTDNRWEYIATDSASRYDQLAGGHYWYTAPSGTAGNAITFTQAMTLDASGNLGVGATTANSRLEVQASAGEIARFSTAAGYRLHVYANASGNSGSGIQSQNSDLRLSTFDASTNIRFFTGDGSTETERARIDSSGNLLVGTTSQPAFATSRAVVAYGNADYAFAVVNSNADPYGMAMGYTGAAPNGTSNAFFYCQDSGSTQRFSVRSNGGVYNYSANDINLSDRREKTNFVPAKSYLETICAIPVQTFNYIDQNMEEDPGLTLGVVAQDVQAVAPELVTESNWGSRDAPKMRLSIYQTDLQYALMKCIQELKADLDATKAELAALKGA